MLWPPLPPTLLHHKTTVCAATKQTHFHALNTYLGTPDALITSNLNSFVWLLFICIYAGILVFWRNKNVCTKIKIVFVELFLYTFSWMAWIIWRFFSAIVQLNGLHGVASAIIQFSNLLDGQIEFRNHSMKISSFGRRNIYTTYYRYMSALTFDQNPAKQYIFPAMQMWETANITEICLKLHHDFWIFLLQLADPFIACDVDVCILFRLLFLHIYFAHVLVGYENHIQ